MDKRDEIRERLAEKLYAQRWFKGQPTWEETPLKDLFRNYALQIQSLLDSMGVVIIKDRELPSRLYGGRAGFTEEAVKQDMLMAGYVATERLIKE